MSASAIQTSTQQESHAGTARDFLRATHAEYDKQAKELDEVFEAFMLHVGTDKGAELLEEYRRLLTQARAYNDLQAAKARKLATRGSVKEIRLVSVPEDERWQEQNKEAAIDEAQHRANQSRIEFTVFSVGNGLFGIVPSDSYRESFGAKVETVQPRN